MTESKKTTIIAVANQKGGVGKTTTAIHLAHALTQFGYKVLMVDGDPQANLTMGQGQLFPDELDCTLSDLYESELSDNPIEDIDAVIRNDAGTDYIPTDISMASKELAIVVATRREYLLKDILSKIKKHYDYIIIDSPPSLGMLFVNVLTAADEIIIPVQAQFFGAKGLELLLGSIMNTKRKLNPDLVVKGALITMVDARNGYNGKVADEIRESFGEAIPILYNTIPVSVMVSRGQEKAKSVIEWKKDNNVAKQYIEAARELIADGRK